MRAWWMSIGLMAAACNSTGSTDDKDSGVVVPDDTEDTDGTPVDTWSVNTDTADTDTDIEVDTDTDTTGPTPPPDDTARDSAECPFGEVLDCDGVCYPAYFIGDGNCDDGSNFQSNFDCVTYAFDGGDCDPDTGTTIDTDAGGCLYVVHIETATWAAEMGWQLLDASGSVLYEVFAGTYTNGRDFYHTVLLPPGDYEFVKIDSFGDGWNGGTYEIYEASSQVVLAQGSLPGGTYDRDPFTATCVAEPIDTEPTGDTDLAACGEFAATMMTTGWGGEISWEIRERGTSTTVVTSPAYLSNQTVVTPFSLDSGWYELVMRDAFGDGWNGASLSIDDLFLGSNLLTQSLTNGAESAVPFYVDCSDTFNPAPDVPLSPTCRDVRLILHTAGFGGDYGWELFDQDGAVLVAAAPVGTYQSNRRYEVPLALEGGDYNMHLIDDFGDGWGGGYVQIVDTESGVIIAEDGVPFAAGFDYWFAFTLTCPPDDTDITPLPDGVCAPGAIPDCLGVCWPVDYRGDGNCDDGTTYAANFYCPALLWDGGDCGPAPQP
jgi:hypothetical protein